MDSVRVLAVLVLIAFVQSGANGQACKTVRANFGYIPPEPPYNFIFKSRGTFAQGTDGPFLYEIHFDMDKQRVLFVETSENGTTTRVVEDYRQKYRIIINGFEADAVTDRPVCYLDHFEDKWDATSGFKMLYYGLLKYRQMAKQHNIRGIPAYQFTACHCNNKDGDFFTSDDDVCGDPHNITYSFTVPHQDYLGPFGRVGAYQMTINGNSEKDHQRHDIFWYNPDPYFNDEYFEIPPLSFCNLDDFLDDEMVSPFDKMSSYSAKHETIVQYIQNQKTEQILGHFDVWVNFEHSIIREDYTSVDCKHGEGKLGPKFCNTQIRAIHDFESGLGYITSIHYGVCEVVPLSDLASDPDITVKGGMVRMVGISSVLWNQDYYFVMKKTYKGIPVNMYLTNYFTDSVNGRLGRSTIELYYLDEAWEDKTFNKLDGKVPIRYKKETIFSDGKEPKNMTTISNTFKLNEQPPSLDVYHPLECLRGLSYVTFTYEMKTGIDSNAVEINDELLQAVKDQVQISIAKSAKTRFLNVKLFQLYKTRDGIGAYVEIFDSPSITGATKPGITAHTALNNFKIAFTSGFYELDITFPGDVYMEFGAVKNSLQVIHK